MLLFVGFYIVLFISNYAVEVKARSKSDLVAYEIYKSGKLVPVHLSKKTLIKEIDKLIHTKEPLIMTLPLPTPVPAASYSLFSVLREKISGKKIPPTIITAENSKPFKRHKRDSEGGFERVIIVRREPNSDHEQETETYHPKTDCNEHSIFSELENDNLESGNILADTTTKDPENMSIESNVNEDAVSTPNWRDGETNNVNLTTVSEDIKAVSEDIKAVSEDIKAPTASVTPMIDNIQTSTIDPQLEKDEPNQIRVANNPMIIDLSSLTTSRQDEKESPKVDLTTTSEAVGEDLKIETEIDLRDVQKLIAEDAENVTQLALESNLVATTPEVTTVKTTTWVPVWDYVDGGAS